MSKTQEALKLALEALEWNLPVIEDYGTPNQLKMHHKALTTIYEALADSALDKMAENARELGLDYEQDVVLPGGGHTPAVPVAVYGYCPECGGAGVMRERRPNGDDKCTNGHKYPSSKALAEQPEPPPECQTEAEKTAFAFGWWKALEENRKQPAQDREPCGWRMKHNGEWAYSFTEDAWDFIGRVPKAQQQEPVATVAEVHMSRYTLEWTNGPLPEGTKLYTSPPASKPWVGLTEAEHTQIAVECGCMSADWVFYGAAVERKLREKNA